MSDNKRQNLRKQTLTARDRLSAGARLEKSRLAVENLLSLPDLKRWSTLFIYVNFRSELETIGLIRRCLDEGKRVTVPLVDPAAESMTPILILDPEKDLVPGYCGIPEPDPFKSLRIAPEEIDAAIIPGSVFDTRGGRLGYGGGYYDRFLKDKAPRAKRIGLAFEMQIVDRVPVESHDQQLDILVTEKRIINCF